MTGIFLLYLHRSVKDAVAQTSEIITYEADVQSVHKVDQEVQNAILSQISVLAELKI